jgi:hypothetical protein
MVALFSPSSKKLRRSRKPDVPARSLPATLLTHRISELHRRLIDPASDAQTVKDAKHALLRLLSDPLTLPVITTPPMGMADFRNRNTKLQSPGPNRMCEICDRALPTPDPRIRVSRRKTSAQFLATLNSLS